MTTGTSSTTPSRWPGAVGRCETLPANHTVALTAADEIWLLEEGEVDIFMAERLPDGRSGMRGHLLTVRAGGMVCGFEGARDDSAVDVLAVSRGARVIAMPCGAVASLPVAAHPALIAALDGWVSGLGAGVTRDFTPRAVPSIPFASGTSAEVPPGSLAVGLKDVVWAYLSDGTARYLGLQPLSAAEQPLVPLSPQTWLTGSETFALTAYGTASLLKTPDWWRRVHLFHGILVRCLETAQGKQRAQEELRLAQRSAKTADQVDTTLGRFARLVGTPERPPVAHEPDNALAIACAIACKPLGIAIEATEQLSRRRADDRPLSVEEVARLSRVRARQIALRGDWWREDTGPLVAFAEDDGRPLAIVPLSATRHEVHDPVKGVRQPLTAALAAGIAPMAWTFFTPLPDGKLSFAALLRFAFARQGGDMITALAAGALGGLLGLAVPLATGLVFQHVIPGHLGNQMVQVGLALIMAAAVSTILKITGDVALLRMEGRIAGQLQAAVIDRLLRLPSSFFAAYSTGDLAQRTLTVEMTRRAVTGLVLSSSLAGVFSLFSFALLFWYQPAAAAAAGGLFLTVLGVSAFAGWAQLKALTEGEQLSGNINGLVLQIIGGIQKLRMAGAEDRAFVRWGQVFAELRARLVKSRAVVNAYAVFNAGWDIVALGVVFLVMSLAAGEDMPTGQFLAFVSAFTMFMASIGQVARAVMQCFSVAPMVRRVQPLLHAVPEVGASKADPGLLTGDIEITNVFFRYDREAPRVLNGLSLQVKPGQFVALVGSSGCGKSTLMKLLLGFEQPEAGGVFYDGRDLRTLDVQSVRRQIGVVLQTGRVMPGSIYENIRGASDASVDEAWDAAAMAGMDEDIRAMPMGLHTLLTEGSAALSGGQVQRLLIARALVSKPKLIFFDEATSALDNRTQAVVTESLSRLSVTRIAIAHRLSTVKDADRIFVLDQGKVVEAGGFDELMRRNGLFADLARRQLS